MAVSDKLVAALAQSVASLDGVTADARAVVEDAYLLSLAFSEEQDYLEASANTLRALEQLRAESVAASKLAHNHAGWLSYHYQHKVGQGMRADMRIVFKQTEGGILLRAFGHRNLPHDFYERIARARRM